MTTLTSEDVSKAVTVLSTVAHRLFRAVEALPDDEANAETAEHLRQALGWLTVARDTLTKDPEIALRVRTTKGSA